MDACISQVELDSVYPNMTPAIKYFQLFTHSLDRTSFSSVLCIYLTLGLSAPITFFKIIFSFKKPNFFLCFLR